MDFVKPIESEDKDGNITIYPLFERINKDAVSKGGKLNAYWNGNEWVSVELADTQLLNDINKEVWQYRNKRYPNNPNAKALSVSLVPSVSREYERFAKNYKGNSEIVFNKRIFFKDDVPSREDYSTTKLSYTPMPGPTPIFDKIMTKWYTEEDIEILLWFIGATLTNNIANVQKFIFIYGSGGSGKGSFLKIVEDIFEDYAQTIKLKKLAGTSQFANSEIKEIPVLIDPETDLSRIDNKENFLALTAHEELWVEKKGKDPYPVTFSGLLITASNKPYDMGNTKSGLGRRVVAVYPTGEKFPTDEYYNLMSQVKFEIAYIAQRAIDTYSKYGIEYINSLDEDYRMRIETDDVYNFVRESVRHNILRETTTLGVAAEAYKVHLEANDWSTKGFKNRIKEELKAYYKEYYEEKRVDGNKLYNVYVGLKHDKIFPEEASNRRDKQRILSEEETLPDYSSDFNLFANSDDVGQLANEEGHPASKWAKVNSKVKDIDQSKLHWVQLPVNRIRIDFDKPTLKENLELSKDYPPTYGELSRSGKGIHLHYLFDGDITTLDTNKHDDIEVKVSTGNSAVRRKFTKSNGIEEIAHISSGLPLKEKKVLSDSKEYITTESSMRNEIRRALRKEHHGATKPEIDFIFKILNDAKDQGVEYDLRDMRQAVMNFALDSTHQSEAALKVYSKMPFSTIMDLVDTPQADVSDGSEAFQSITGGYHRVPDKDLYFFDIEVFKNLLMVSFKRYGEDDVTTWYNPSPEQIEWLLNKPLVGFNNRKYDNHILYAALTGSNNMELYEASIRIIGKSKNAFYAPAYSLAYADILDFSNTKMSLKKWEVTLGLPYDELNFDWNEPLPEADWARAAEYNRNDVEATEEVFKHLYEDYEARLMMAQLTDSPVSNSTNQLSAKFIFGNDKNPEQKLVYTDLSETFPGYKYGYMEKTINHQDGTQTVKKTVHSEYKGEDPSEGGYVYSVPGVYKDVVEMDIKSMHPFSAIALKYFGPYAKRFEELVYARAHVKHAVNKDGSLNRENIDAAKNMLGGALAPYLTDDANFSALAYALKIIINSVYGMSSAKFDNKFKHMLNDDNIIAKRGALFMIDLKEAILNKGWTVVHIKTDSIKIHPDTQEVRDFVTDFGSKYGYDFEIAGEYDKMALVNNAVLIAHYKDGGQKDWHAIGIDYAQPIVYKTLFTHDEIVDDDYILIKESKAGPIYLGDRFIGRVGKFYASLSGQELVWVKDDKRNALTGTKNFLWRVPEDLTSKFDIDMNYYDTMIVDAINKIQKVGDVTELIEVPDVYKGVINQSA